MRTDFSISLLWLVTAASAESFVYSFDQRDVQPLKQQRGPAMAPSAHKRDEKSDYASHNHLFPAVHPDLDTKDLGNLHSRRQHSLFYTQNGGISRSIPRPSADNGTD